MVTEKELGFFSEGCQRILHELERDIVGQRETLENAVIAMIAGGNILFEGVPGVGKTRLVRSMARVFGMPFSRIQFTPDLMPADVTGTNILEKDEEGRARYRFQPGPVFANIVLADEINRATPKTQSALLEAMQEHRVSVVGQDYPLPEPFFVLATQNPIEQEGTYPLPEAQIDRFMFKLIIPFPSADDLQSIILLTQKTMDEVAEQVSNAEALLSMRETAKEIPVIDSVVKYAIAYVTATHAEGNSAGGTASKYIRLGASPRAGQMLITAAKVRALMNGRYNVSYADIDALAHPVLRHRIKLSMEAIAERKTPDMLLDEIANEVRKTVGGKGK